MRQRYFSQFQYHTKLIGAFAWEQIRDFFGKVGKTVQFGAIFGVQKKVAPVL